MPLLQAIEKELHLQSAYLGMLPITSIYLGGGTPSLLSTTDFEKLLICISRYLSLSEVTEITIEANPDDITLTKLQDLRTIGVNRLSIGVQSFQDVALRYLNRIHNGKCAIDSVRIARKAGFDNVSIDLMYAIPGMCQASWEADLLMALQLQPDHIAAYSLTIEKRTVFGHWYASGKLQVVQESHVVRQFETLIAYLTAHHYEHYEVSNFCQPGCYAQHNTNYWKHGPYLGLGPGAHSYNGHTRQHNIAHNQRYIDSLQSGIVPCTVEILTKKDHINEYLMTSLRTQWGCDLTWLESQYGYAITQIKRTYLTQLMHRRLATMRGQRLCLTSQGMLLADQIAMDLFVD